jgi:sugar lactone lactonase YvrE
LPNGSVAFFDNGGSTVRIVSPAAEVATLAGGGRSGGFADGVGAAARFNIQNNQTSLVVMPGGAVALADSGNWRIRRMALATNLVETVAGSGVSSSVDGPVSVATFVYPQALASDAAGNLYVGDAGAVRRISNTGVVSTFAGKPSDYGSADGVGTLARFGQPAGMAMDSHGNLIVADSGNFVIRRIAPDGTVTTLAGKAGQPGYVNGLGSEARLGNVTYLAIDNADNVYFTDSNHAIRKVSPGGEVSPVAGAPYSSGLIDDLGAFARFNGPKGLAFDARGNLYVADSSNNAIRRITPGGQVSTVMGGLSGVLQPGLGGSINQPSAIAVTPVGRLIFLSEGAIVGD